jgi:subtilisin family serine protease
MARFCRVFLLAVLLFGVSGAPPASMRAASMSQVTSTPEKIAPWVLAHTAGGAEAEFLVVLATQADLSSAARLHTKAEKGRYVYETLWRTAQTSQAPLLKWLAARGVEHRPYYIVNLIWVKGDAALAQALAARSDVARIEGNPRIQNVLPQPARPRDALLAAAPTAIEPNITYVRAPEVWAMGYTGQGIVVGGQDTGYEWTHPALQPHYRGWNGTAANHDYNWHDAIHSGGGRCGADSPVPCDDYDHGTHTMGTIVGDDGDANQIGMAPGAQWIGCRNMDVGYGTPVTYLECFEFFLAPYPVGGTFLQGDPSKAPDVTNNSWTCPPSEGCSWSTLQAAVEAQRAAGIMTVVSAGNYGSAGCSSVREPPAIYAAAYTVGALTTGTDTIASLSSLGPVTVDGSNRRKPDLTAPGTGVRSCILNGGYSTKSGTSMAAPHVAGAVALLWSAVPALKSQIEATEQLLNDNAFHIASTACSSSGWPNNVYGYGRLDVKAAVDAALPAPHYGVTLEPPEITRNGNVGTTVVYTLTLANAGTMTDVYSLTLSRAMWPTTLTPTVATLEPGATAPVTAMVTVPWDEFTGITDTARITADGTGVTAHSDLTTVALAAFCVPLAGVDFSYTPTRPTGGQVITFTGAVEIGTPPVDYSWDFGDGSPPVYGEVVTHTFAANTTVLPYTVKMTADNPCSQETVSRIVTVGLYHLYLPLIIKPAETIFLPARTSAVLADDAVSGALPAAAPTFEDGGPWVVRAYYTGEQMVRDLAAWNEPWEVDRDARYAVIEVEVDAYARLLAAGFRLEIDAPLTMQLRQPNVMLPGQTSGIPGYPCYRTVEETYAAAESIATAYPHLATWIDIGDSWEKIAPGGNPGYDMLVLRLTNAVVPGPKPALFVMSSMHAREYTPAELNMRFAEYLVEHYDVDADVTWLLDYHEIHLLLHANPDGRKKAEAGMEWRKNTNENYCSLTPDYRGADLNRNYAFQWGCCGGGSNSPCDLTYRGPTPASEPETQVVQNYARALFPDQRADDLTVAAPLTATGIFLDLHSYSQLVLWSWGFTSTPAPNAAGLRTLGRKFAYFNGYTPDQAMSLYPTDGTTDSFAYGELGLAAYTFELGNYFFESCAAFENTILPTNMPALIYAAKAAHAPYMTPSGPEALSVTVTPAGAPVGPVAHLSAIIDDTHYNNSRGDEPTQSIAAAEYYISVPPWDEQAQAYPLAAADGSFDAPIEVVTATLNLSGLTVGRHTVYVRGQDADGNWGVVSAAFITLSEPVPWPFAVYLPLMLQE